MCIISPKNKPLEEESPEELSPEGKKYMKFRDLNILFKYRRNM
jgi:hypothetical protein